MWLFSSLFVKIIIIIHAYKETQMNQLYVPLAGKKTWKSDSANFNNLCRPRIQQFKSKLINIQIQLQFGKTKANLPFLGWVKYPQDTLFSDTNRIFFRIFLKSKWLIHKI